MRLTNQVLLSGFFTLSLLGCQGEVLDVPGGGGGEGTGGGAGESGSIVYRGRYFSSPADFTLNRIELTFSSLSESEVEGTIVFGDARLELPKMDVTTSYPAVSGEWAAGGGAGWSPVVFEGHPYPVTGTLSGGRLRLEYDIRGPFEPWCAAQESLFVPEAARLDPGVAYSCTPYTNPGFSCGGPEPCTIFADGLPTLEVDMPHHEMCAAGICACDESGCAVLDPSAAPGLASPYLKYELELVLDGDVAENNEMLLTRQ